jgi:hypothetical protein
MKIIWEDNGYAFDQFPVVEALEPEVAEAAEAEEDTEETQYQPPSGTGFGW